MIKFRTYVQRLTAILAGAIIIITVGLYLLSNAVVSLSYTGLSRGEISRVVTQGVTILENYLSGEISEEKLQTAINPVLNPSEAFLMLFDEDGKVLAYSTSMEDILNPVPLEEILSQLPLNGGVSSIETAKDKELLLMGEHTELGYVVAGKSLSAYLFALKTFRRLLLNFMIPLGVFLLILSFVLSHIVSKPSDVLVDAAQHVSEGELVQITTPLPPDLKPIGKAFNEMSYRLNVILNKITFERRTLSLLLQELREGVLAVDEAGEILHENPAAHSLLGGAESDTYALVLRLLQKAVFENVEDLKLQQGEMTLLVRFSALPQDNHRRRGALATIIDMTEQERLDRTRRDYVGNISHELRTPLSSMRGLAEALRDGLVTNPEEQTRYLNMIVGEILRMTRLVNDLLELSSLQSNPEAFETEKISVAEAMDELMCRCARLAKDRNLNLALSLPEEKLPDVETNDDRLQQVLTILMDNALKFTPEGGTITIGAETATRGIRFFVRDTGIGMDEETRLHCFERFVQGDKSHRGSGSGLGLSIASEIVQRMGAHLQVSSVPGQGSEFSFILKNEG